MLENDLSSVQTAVATRRPKGSPKPDNKPKVSTIKPSVDIQEYLFNDGDVFVHFNVERVNNTEQDTGFVEELAKLSANMCDTSEAAKTAISLDISSFIKTNWKSIKQIDTSDYRSENSNSRKILHKHLKLSGKFGYDLRGDKIENHMTHDLVRRLKELVTVTQEDVQKALENFPTSIVMSLLEINPNSIFKYLTQVDDYLLLDYKLDEFQSLTFYFKTGDLILLNTLAKELSEDISNARYFICNMKDKGINKALTLLLDLIVAEPNTEDYIKVLSGEAITSADFKQATKLSKYTLSSNSLLAYNMHQLNVTMKADKFGIAGKLKAGKPPICVSDYSDAYVEVLHTYRYQAVSEENKVPVSAPILKMIQCYSEPNSDWVDKPEKLDAFIALVSLELFKQNPNVLKKYTDLFPRCVLGNLENISKSISNLISDTTLDLIYFEAFGETATKENITAAFSVIESIFGTRAVGVDVKEVENSELQNFIERYANIIDNLPASLVSRCESVEELQENIKMLLGIEL